MTDGEPLGTALRQFQRIAEHGTFPNGRSNSRYLACGHGEPLVIIHGLADQALSFAPLMTALAPHHHCIAYDLCHDARAVGDHVYGLLTLLDHLRLDRAMILGSSFGSTIALQAMIAAPARITLGILQGGFARRPLRRFERRLAQLARSWPGRLADVPFRAHLGRKLDGPAFLDAAPGSFDFFLSCSGATPIRVAARRALALDRLDLRPRLGLVRQAVLMIGGDRDTIVPRRFEQEVEAGLGRVRRVEFPRCGHYPQYTHPIAMANAICGFVREAGS